MTLRRAFAAHLVVGSAMATGCGPHARVDLAQPRGDGSRRQLHLESAWAQFTADDGPWDRLLLAWPLPGARAGNKHFVAYLRFPPGGGEFSAQADHPAAGDLTGFVIQRSGERACLSRVQRGALRIAGGPYRRAGRLDLHCADGMTLRGEFQAIRSKLALRFFEEEHAADVAALAAPEAG